MQETASNRTVLITGASGRIGRVLAEGLCRNYSLVLTDSCPKPGDPYPVIQADACDLAVMRELCAGVDTVIPLAINGGSGSDWNLLVPGNFSGIWAALQAAVEMNCRRVILPSTILLYFGAELPYAAAKLWAEQLSQEYAGRTELSVLVLRLGRVVSTDDPIFAPRDFRLNRILTERDLVNLITATIEAPDALRYGVFWGISDNRGAFVNINETRRMLGYRPRDDAYRIAWKGMLRPRGVYRLLQRKIKKWKSR